MRAQQATRSLQRAIVCDNVHESNTRAHAPAQRRITGDTRARFRTATHRRACLGTRPHKVRARLTFPHRTAQQRTPRHMSAEQATRAHVPAPNRTATHVARTVARFRTFAHRVPRRVTVCALCVLVHTERHALTRGDTVNAALTRGDMRRTFAYTCAQCRRCRRRSHLAHLARRVRSVGACRNLQVGACSQKPL